LRSGQLDAHRAVPIGGGEVACPGDVVATRRNDRTLCTQTGEPVRNRDLWDVIATHPDGSLTVSHRNGHGLATLPANHAKAHVRLGYAATEHGHQGDTVDIGLELVSAATTHRGLYVGATRGRNENRLHVVTDTDDPAEARDVLNAVLAHDRADIPAVTQRRDLARHAPPRPPHSVEPVSTNPDWVSLWRVQLEVRRADLLDYIADRAAKRAEAEATLADFQPVLAAARAAWQPHAEAIAGIEHELQSELRPAMWSANHDAMHAGFGRHRSSRRLAKAVTERVVEAQARARDIYAGAADVKERLDASEAHARNLHDLVHPSPGACGGEDVLRRELHDIDRLLHAGDVWTAWANGQTITLANLIDTAEILGDVARRAPIVASTERDIERSQWIELLAPLVDLLHQRGIELAPDAPDLEQAVLDLGLEL
jgi:hypothetical protein